MAGMQLAQQRLAACRRRDNTLYLRSIELDVDIERAVVANMRQATPRSVPLAGIHAKHRLRLRMSHGEQYLQRLVEHLLRYPIVDVQRGISNCHVIKSLLLVTNGKRFSCKIVRIN